MTFKKWLFPYVFDSSSLINVERSKKMTILRRRKDEVLIPEKVAVEINQPNTPLHRFISNFREVVTRFENDEEEEYLRVRSQVGIDDGEAAAIAMAIKRRLTLIIDDKKAKQKAEKHGVPTHTWQDFVQGH